MTNIVGLCPKSVSDASFSALVVEYEAQFPSDPPDQVRVAQIVQQAQIANGLAPGDYIELGVFRGMTLKVIYRYMDQQRTLYGLDTFTGFDARDIVTERKLYLNGWREGNFLQTSPEMVARYVGDGKCPANVRLVPGRFPESFANIEADAFRFAHVDMDLHDPTLKALELLWPRMVPGGIIMAHDYGCPEFRVPWAVDEFCARVNVPPVILADRYATAVIRKPFR